MTYRSGRRVVLAGLLGVLFVAAAWSAWQAFNVYRDLSAASVQATELRTTLAAGDRATSARTLEDLSAHLGDARSRTDTRTWAVLAHLPLVGDDVRGVRVVSAVLDDLTRDGIAPVVGSAAGLEQLSPVDGQIPLDAVAAMRDPIAQADTAFSLADERLAAEDSSGYVGRWQVKYDELADLVADASTNLGAADTAMEVLPGMLGADGPRRYLVVFQNNAEVRATGGLPGVVAMVPVDDGRIGKAELVTSNTFAELPDPVLPLSAAEEQIYGEQLGTWFLDANFTPDFARAAELWRSRWEQERPRIDGVIAVDPVALSYLLAATGPVSAGPFALTADNAVDTLLHDVYVQIPDPVAQDEAFRAIGQALITQIVGGVGAPAQLLGGLARSADEHRVLVHSFHADEEEVLADTAVAGHVVSDPAAPPQVGVYLDDNTGAKMSYYLRTRVRVQGRTCVDGVQALAGTARLTSLAPADAATSLPDSVTGGGLYGVPAGSQIVAVRLYAPVGGTIGDVELNSTSVPLEPPVDQDGRPVATAYVQLDPQESVDLTFEMTTGPGQTGDTVVSVTPGVEGRDLSSTAATAC